jgi:hypothetical protein
MVGLAWTEIAATLPGRTANQGCFRFVNAIGPSLKKSFAWTAEKDPVKNRPQMELVNKWTEIARLLPGCSGIDVKNRRHSAKT